jgi:hypothetical protein
MKTAKLFARVFAIAFFSNLIWENLHSFLYLHYQGGVISEMVLLRAAFVDAAIIVCALTFVRMIPPRYRMRIFTSMLFVVAICIEWWALATNRWAYSPLMPIIPFLGVGLSPAIQLIVIAWLSLRISKLNNNSKK